ncbi:MAG: Gfo/Idh/MocA family oxidoreductase [Oscillospiraceae bacterium]|nr:Gfo/Idh/MocA family oxidoreductase [Oscillospiraceae bacterium]
MLKAALIGIGAMGSGHLDNYLRMKKENNPDINLVAVCDIDESKFKNNQKIQGNLDGVGGGGNVDFSGIHCYTDIDDMLEKEQLDMVSIALPTYLHCEYTVKCLDKGINTFCEKPMALNHEQCQQMIDAAKRGNKKLMIGHCLRFWGQYEVTKEIITSGKFGKPIAGYFFRGGDTPVWSYNNWLLKRECGGGALLDQHVHDVDTVNYFFGMPKAVSALGSILYKGSGYDAVTAQYIYDDPITVNAQDDWSLAYGGFTMTFRVNFENGSVIMPENGGFICAARGDKDNPKTPNGKPYTPEYDKENAYYKEIKYFADCIIHNKPVLINPPEDSMNTIRIVRAEIESADKNGAIVEVK